MPWDAALLVRKVSDAPANAYNMGDIVDIYQVNDTGLDPVGDAHSNYFKATWNGSEYIPAEPITSPAHVIIFVTGLPDARTIDNLCKSLCGTWHQIQTKTLTVNRLNWEKRLNDYSTYGDIKAFAPSVSVPVVIDDTQPFTVTIQADVPVLHRKRNFFFNLNASQWQQIFDNGNYITVTLTQAKARVDNRSAGRKLQDGDL